MSLMRQETLAIIDTISRQLTENQAFLEDFAGIATRFAPEFVVTVARGSSDHAATFVKYLCEIQFGLLTSSAAPSVYTLYKAPTKLDHALVISLSQSGQSPDICEVVQYAREKEALTLALVNEVDSPLAKLSEYVLPLLAGKEKAVAATKSYMAMLTAMLHFTAIYKQDEALLQALKALPEQLKTLTSLDFSPFFPPFADTINALVIGRGYGFPIAQEIALKFKEVTQIHAESFSSAEVLHGPFSLFNDPLPILIFMQNDETLPSVHSLIQRIRQTPVRPLLIGNAETLKGCEDLPHITIPETHPLVNPILTVFVMYQFIEQLAILKGLNPDSHPLIQKVTKTV